MTQIEADTTSPVETPHGTVCLRTEVAADEPFVLNLFESVKAAELAAMQVDAALRRQLLTMQFRAMTLGYRAAYPAARYEIVTLDEVPAGRLITDSGPNWFHIVYIALRPDLRKLGLGTALMQSVLDAPRSMNIPCQATVALDNAASLRLWSKLGFTERSRSMTDVIVEWLP